MALLGKRLLDRTVLDADTVDHLQLLLADWQILADLSFADLLLFVGYTLVDGTAAYLCVGQMRPYTAQTIYSEDLVGQAFPVTDRPMVGRAFAEQRVIRDADPDWSTGVPVREEAIPVRFHGKIAAVVTREANVATARSPSQLELTYLQSAGELAQMLADGNFPYPGDQAEEREVAPRVGDGIMRVDAEGRVTYASPNAISAYRRLGSLENLLGQNLRDFDLGHDELLEALRLGESRVVEVERQEAVVMRRLLPLIGHDDVIGGLLLVREVTELRRHERALRLKDATIREIHHRVKNNLQTVAALLRLQGRRLQSVEAREALAESVRRIASIALVHETLSQESTEHVDFAKVARRIIDMLADGLTDPDIPVLFVMEGEPGDLPAAVATPLALVLTELLANCIEHAYPAAQDDAAAAGGAVRISFSHDGPVLGVEVSDDGVGLPEGLTLDAVANLGLQIARTLVESELGGTFSARSDRSGTSIRLALPLR
jgi:two-component sensor histidine kinase